MGKLNDAPVAGPTTNAVSKAPTSEQLRIAQLLVDPKSEDHSITKDKVNKVMELTRCNESTALVALHDCDNDVEHAVDKLLEGDHQGVWIVQEGKKSKKVQQHQQPHYQQSYQYQQQHVSKENHAGDEDNSGKHFDDYEDDNSKSFSAPYHARGSSRGGGHVGGDFPPRFRGRGGSGGVRSAPRKFDKENEPSDFGGDRGRGGWRGRGRGRGEVAVGGERGRGRGFANRGARRGGGFGNKEDGGFDQQMGNWNSTEVESNTWDNSMATSCKDGGTRRPDEWKGPEDSNTWDNSMAQAAPAPAKPKKQQRSNEWNNNTADDWGGEEDWSKLRDGLVIEKSGVHKQQTVPATAPVSSSSHTTGASSYAAVSGSGNHVRGESIDVNMLFTHQQLPDNQSNSSQAMWSSKQATADLKNELGIGKVAPAPLVDSTGHLRQRDPLPAKQSAVKVELPSMGGRNMVGPIDVQFGDMTLLSDSQPLFAFDAPTAFKSQTNAVSSQSQDPSLRQGQIGSSTGVFQRTQKNEHANGPDLMIGSGEGGAKVVDVAPNNYSIGGYAQTQQQEQQQFGSASTTIRQMNTAPAIKSSNSGLNSLTSNHQRAMLSGNNVGGGGGNVPAQVSVNDSAVHQALNQAGISLNVGSSAHGPTTTTNYGLSSAQQASRSPANIVNTRPQVTSSLNVNPTINQYQQAALAAGLSPYLNMYDQMSLNSVGFLPPQNLFLNAAGGFDMRALTQLPQLGNTAGRDSGDMKQYMRQDTASNLAAAASGLANLSVPPPGLPAPTVSNAEQAAQILSLAGLYPALPYMNQAAPPYLAPQFLVPNISSASTVTTGSQYQRTSGYPQPPMFNAAGFYAGYEDMQLSSQDYGKSNYGALSGNQTKTVSSGGGGMTMGVNDGNKAYAAGLKGAYDPKTFAPATATPPPLGNMSFPFQTTAATNAAYGYANYMPPVNMNMMASPMAAAMASNVQLSNDLLGTGQMNQRGVGQNSKTSSMGKPTGYNPYPAWGN